MIPKSQRKESKLEVLKLSMNFNKDVLVSFGSMMVELVSSKRIENSRDHIVNYSCNVLNKYTNMLINSSQNNIKHIVSANSIYPTIDIEYEDKLKLILKSIEECSNINAILETLASLVPSKASFIAQYSSRILSIQKAVRKWKASVIKSYKNIDIETGIKNP